MKLKRNLLVIILSTQTISIGAYADQCDATECDGFTLPLVAKKIISSGYSNIEVGKIKNNKYLYLSGESDVNKCSVIFKFDNNKIENIPAAGENGKLCNISEDNEHVLSSRREQGMWYNDVYKISPKGDWVLLFTDSCADCQQVKRTYFKNGIKSHSELMSEGESYASRNPLVGIISVPKASLYCNPDEQKNKAYLIKGDTFTLTDMSEDGTFYQVNYKSSKGKDSLYWIKSDGFDIK